MLRSINEPVTYFSPVPEYVLGQLYYSESDAKVYRYVKAAAALNNSVFAVGEMACADTGGAYWVSNDVAGGTGLKEQCMGIAISLIPIINYGWVQVCGMAEVTATDGSVAQGEYITTHATTDGGVDTFANGLEEQAIGFTLAADVGNVVTIQLRGLI